MLSTDTGSSQNHDDDLGHYLTHGVDLLGLLALNEVAMIEVTAFVLIFAAYAWVARQMAKELTKPCRKEP